MNLGLVCALLLAGCHKQPSTTAAADLATVPSPTPQGLSGVRAAIVARNYAQAEALALAEIRDRPGDPAARFELARAEALLNNQGKALDALEAAVAAGLPDAARALDDPAFALLADSDRFAALQARAAPRPAGLSAGSGADGVDIRESAGGTQIRAGDVKLDTRF